MGKLVRLSRFNEEELAKVADSPNRAIFKLLLLSKCSHKAEKIDYDYLVDQIANKVAKKLREE